MESRKISRRRSRSAVIYIPVAVLLIIFIGVFGTSVFLRVTAVEVTGASRYAVDSIIAASGFTLGDNLLMIDENAAVISIRAKMPYISNLKIVRRFPDTVVIEIEESEAAAVISSQGTEWIIDSGGRILEKLYTAPSGLITVSGVTLLDPAVGKQCAVTEGAEARLECMKAVLGPIVEAGIRDEVSSLDVSNIARVTFNYAGRFTVVLGTADDVSFKINKMIEHIGGMADADNASGTIYMSGNEYSFIPDQL